MAYTPKVLYPTNYPSTSGSVLYTTPGPSTVIIKNIVMTNTTNAEALITINVVPSGDSAQNSNAILYQYGVPANGVSTFDCSIVLPGGSFIRAVNSTNNAISVTISGVEIT